MPPFSTPPAMQVLPDVLRDLAPESILTFAGNLPVRELAGREARVVARRRYVFGEDATLTYALAVEGVFGYHLTVAEDEAGLYLGLSRELPRSEWGDWFDEDALDFFLTPSSARLLKRLPSSTVPEYWAAPRYQKMLDAAEGKLIEDVLTPEQTPSVQPVYYTLLADEETGEKSIEIETLPNKKATRIYATLYLPHTAVTAFRAAPEPQHPPEEPQAMAEPELAEKPARPDFRRRSADRAEESRAEDIPSLPAFLLAPQPRLNGHAPSAVQLTCDAQTARALTERAERHALDVETVLREAVGLSPLQEPQSIPVHLSEEDYQTLAMRYQIKITQREEIHKRLAAELRERLAGA